MTSIWLIRTYEEARSFAGQHHMAALVAQADYNIASLHYLRGEYSKAIALLRGARAACETSGDRHHFGLCHLNLSEIYLEMNMGSEAEESASTAKAAFLELGMRYEQGKASANLAIALSQQGKIVESLAQFEDARALFRAEKNQVWGSLLDLYQAIALYKHELYAEARNLASSTLHFFRKNGQINRAALCYLLLARVACRTHDLRSAVRHCYRALICLDSIESPALSCQAHGLMAQVQKTLGNTSNAFEHYQLAKRYLEQLRGGIRHDELKISFMRDRVEIYEGLVDLCLSSGPDSDREALEYIEQAKSRSLFDLITTVRNPIVPVGESVTARRIRELKQELNWYHHRIEIEQLRNKERAGPQLAQLRSERRKREQDVLRLLREHPEPDAGVPEVISGGRIDIAKIQAALHPEATIVEYFQLQNRLIAAVLTGTDVAIVELGKIETCETTLGMLRFQMAKPRLGAEYAATFENVLLKTINHCLHQLYVELLAPIRDRLKTSHLVIVPHGPLHHLPFHALFDGEKYLLEEFTISYAPSASIYTFCNARVANKSGPSLILGVPDPAIPGVEAEAKAVAKILPDPHLVIGPDAASSLVGEKGPKCRFLHIATHGYFREDQPMFSGIRMADSYLSLSDLYQMSLPVELVTLSGCSTGLNVVSAGDEILGLARGLICAGAQSALLSLWDVQDQSTCEFMTMFYSGLANGRNKAEAVREATLRLRKSRAHPYYWAPFVLMGKTFPN